MAGLTGGERMMADGVDGLNVTTTSGRVRGRSAHGVRRWLGIPYAHAERFATPGPPVPWDGVRDAMKAGPQCPQMYGNAARRAQLAAPAFAEDCLSLNIYAPENVPGGDALPVYVWIHGGAFVAGGGAPYSGVELARSGGIIVVTINYRLGVLGFVNFGAVLPGIPSNPGLRDQIAALGWVRDNIAAFGGDPARVTVGGQSAGSMAVSLLLHAPSAWPLFAGAILQSGAISLIHSKARSENIVQDYMAALDHPDLATLRSMPLERLFAAQAAVGAANPGTIPSAPWFDGDLIPASLADTRSSAVAPVPLLAGATRDEIRLFELMPGDILPTRRPVLQRLLQQQLPAERADAILAAYPHGRKGRRALATDLTFAMPTRHFADRHSLRHPTWYYRFDYRHPIAGATHGLDLTLTWPMRGWRAALARGGPMRGRRAALGARMTAHIAHFVRHGRPLDDWPAYAPNRRAVKIFDLKDRVEIDPDAARWRAWAGCDVGVGLAE